MTGLTPVQRAQTTVRATPEAREAAIIARPVQALNPVEQLEGHQMAIRAGSLHLFCYCKVRKEDGGGRGMG